MPQLPQMPIRHDQRNARVLSISSLTWLSAVEDRPLLAQRDVVLLPAPARVSLSGRYRVTCRRDAVVPWLPPVDPLARRPAGDRHRQLLDPRRPVGVAVRPAGGSGTARRPAPGKSVRWWAPRDSSRCSPEREDALGDVEHVGQLERGDQLGVERPAGVRERRPCATRSCSSARVVDALGHRRVRCGRCRRPPPSSPASRRGSSATRLGARRRAEQVALEPAHLVGRLRGDDGRRRGRRSAAYSAAARPARAPKTRHSGSELEPSRLAPLMLTQAVSPAAYSPAERGRAVDVGVDPAHHVVHDRAGPGSAR